MMFYSSEINESQTGNDEFRCSPQNLKAQLNNLMRDLSLNNLKTEMLPRAMLKKSWKKLYRKKGDGIQKNIRAEFFCLSRIIYY